MEGDPKRQRGTPLYLSVLQRRGGDVYNVLRQMDVMSIVYNAEIDEDLSHWMKRNDAWTFVLDQLVKPLLPGQIAPRVGPDGRKNCLAWFFSYLDSSNSKVKGVKVSENLVHKEYADEYVTLRTLRGIFIITLSNRFLPLRNRLLLETGIINRIDLNLDTWGSNLRFRFSIEPYSEKQQAEIALVHAKLLYICMSEGWHVQVAFRDEKTKEKHKFNVNEQILQ